MDWFESIDLVERIDFPERMESESGRSGTGGRGGDADDLRRDGDPPPVLALKRFSNG